MYAFTAALSFLLLNIIFAHPGHFDEDPECRQPHHHRHEENDCCKVPSLFSKNKDEMHELVHKCAEEAGFKKHGPHHEHHGPPALEDGPIPPPPPFSPKNDSKFDCVEQCFLKNLELVDDEGDVKVDDLKALVTEKLTGDWASVGSAAIEKCLEKAKTEENEPSKCKAGSKRILHCLAREFFMNCPASDWTDSEVCLAARDRVSKCPHSLPPMHH
uniref:OBP47-like domain-containing protein n=1 Tax=Lygus hesperus TaxID=30085 RepID=A0A146L195_LYGHE